MQSKTFVRSDINKGAIINVDHDGLSAYKKQRQILKDSINYENRFKKLENSIEELKTLILNMASNNK